MDANVRSNYDSKGEECGCGDDFCKSGKVKFDDGTMDFFEREVIMQVEVQDIFF